MTKRKVTDLLPTEAILISCDAERDAVLKLFHDAGVKWANGSSTIESYPSFDYPLGLELDIDVLWNNSIYIYESIGRKILPATDFIPTEAEKVEETEYSTIESVFKLAKWILENRVSSLIDADIPQHDKDMIARYFGYSTDLTNP